MKISFIIPVYNTKPAYLERCIKSIVAVKCDSKEIIIVNDGSKNEETIRFLESIKSKQSVYVLSKENGGSAEARNYGLDVATGEYIMFVDADDSLNSDELEYGISVLKGDNKTDLLCFTYNVLDEFGNNTKVGNSSRQVFKLNSISNLEKLRNKSEESVDFGVGAVWGKIYSKTLISNHRFDEDLKYCEDKLFVLCLEKVNQIIAVCANAYNYYQYGTSICHKYNPRASREYGKSITKLEQYYASTCVDGLNSFYYTVVFYYLLSNILNTEVFNAENKKSVFIKCFQSRKIRYSEPYNHIINAVRLHDCGLKTKILLIMLKFGFVVEAYYLSRIHIRKNNKEIR